MIKAKILEIVDVTILGIGYFSLWAMLLSLVLWIYGDAHGINDAYPLWGVSLSLIAIIWAFLWANVFAKNRIDKWIKPYD